jgi:hypothetical protein
MGMVGFDPDGDSWYDRLHGAQNVWNFKVFNKTHDVLMLLKHRAISDMFHLLSGLVIVC